MTEPELVARSEAFEAAIRGGDHDALDAFCRDMERRVGFAAGSGGGGGGVGGEAWWVAGPVLRCVSVCGGEGGGLDACGAGCEVTAAGVAGLRSGRARLLPSGCLLAGAACPPAPSASRRRPGPCRACAAPALTCCLCCAAMLSLQLEGSEEAETWAFLQTHFAADGRKYLLERLGFGEYLPVDAEAAAAAAAAEASAAGGEGDAAAAADAFSAAAAAAEGVQQMGLEAPAGAAAAEQLLAGDGADFFEQSPVTGVSGQVFVLSLCLRHLWCRKGRGVSGC